MSRRLASRATRLGRVFARQATVYFEIFFKYYKSGLNFWSTFLKGASYVRIDFDKNHFGCILGDFFPPNSSGHPACIVLF
jgi:hypothetical protein